MEKWILGVLYIDENAARPTALCGSCGGEIYGLGGCIRCEATDHDLI